MAIFQLESPLDMHLHLREGEMLSRVAPLSARSFAGAVIMPNLVPPVDNAARLDSYRAAVDAAAGDAVFDPYMGVGTAVVAALMHGRMGYGCDIVREYVDIAWERVEALRSGTLRTRPMGKPVYDPTKPRGGH